LIKAVLRAVHAYFLSKNLTPSRSPRGPNRTGTCPNGSADFSGRIRRDPFESRFCCGVASSWSLRFAEPIALADGAKRRPCAIAHLVKTITAAERGSPEVLIAAELLTNAAEHGDPVEFARIAILQALMLGQHVLDDIHRAAIAHHG
jgi:hypothetical protein